MKEAFVVGGVRTGVGKYRGSLSSVRPDDMAAHVIRELMLRHAAVPAEEVDDVIFGCANQAGEDNRNVARMAALLAGLPSSVPGETVNRLCASGLSAVVHAARAVQTGAGEVFIAGGVESMTRAPYVLSKSAEPFGRDSEVFDTTIGWRFANKKLEELFGIDSMGQTAENVAEQFKISREDQDLFATRSQQKAAAARESGRLSKEIVPIEVSAGKRETKSFAEDEFIRPDTSPEGLSKLRTVFRENGGVTAGNASGINDGAAALLICSEEVVKRYSLSPLARFVGAAAAGVEPRVMGIGPVRSTERLLKRTGMTIDQMGVIELNEAFAAQSLACLRQLGIDDDDERVNPNGGAIAIGHPLGMSGARLVLSAAIELQQQSTGHALCTMCVGVGQGMSAIFEKV
jgi:3-oxoadipyl-CoA thiolase